MGRGGKRTDAGRKPKFVGGTYWLHLAIPEALREAIEAQGHAVDSYVLTLISSAYPKVHWQAQPQDPPAPDDAPEGQG